MRSLLPALLLSVSLCACGSGVSSDEEARRAYLGLDGAVTKALQLGFDGFNAAKSANIDPQQAEGDAAGTVTVAGQVDQGASDNKTMRLSVALAGYDDGEVSVTDDGETVHVVYDTEEGSLPDLTLQLKGVPDGTLDGTFAGKFRLDGDLEGELTLDLAIHGELQPGEGETVARVPGTTHVTGTATSSGGGSYQVDVTL